MFGCRLAKMRREIDTLKQDQEDVLCLVQALLLVLNYKSIRVNTKRENDIIVEQDVTAEKYNEVIDPKPLIFSNSQAMEEAFSRLNVKMRR